MEEASYAKMETDRGGFAEGENVTGGDIGVRTGPKESAYNVEVQEKNVFAITGKIRLTCGGRKNHKKESRGMRWRR